MFMAAGTAFGLGAFLNYTVGTGARMGPGYFPTMLGVLLAILGAAIVFESLVVETEDGEKVGSIAWKPLGFIIGANVAFGICLGGLPKLGIPSLGLIVGIYALVTIASFAGDRFRPKEVAVLATVLAIFSYCAFVWLLKLQFPVWPAFLVK